VLAADGVADRAGNPGFGRLTNRWTRTTGNAAPTLLALADAVLSEGEFLVFVAQATDADTHDALTFSMAGAPPAATLDPVTGQFAYHPDELAGPRTNQITVTVTDNGIPPRSTDRGFRLVVRNTLPDFSVSLGSTNLFAGQSNALPFTLASGVSLTNLVVQLDIPSGVLQELAVAAGVPDLLSWELTSLGGTRHELRLGFDPTQIQNGVRRVAELSFRTASNQPSTVVWLPMNRPVGRRLSGQMLTEAGANSGRVVMVRDQPVLVALPGGEVEVFGRPGAGYRFESTDALAPAAWTPLEPFTFTNVFRQPVTVPTQGTRFYRLRSP